MSKRCQNDILERFEKTGGVHKWRGRLYRPSPRRTMNADMDVHLLQLVIDSPSASLAEHQQPAEHPAALLHTGELTHVSTICRALKRLHFSRTRVSERGSPRGDNPMGCENDGLSPRARACAQIQSTMLSRGIRASSECFLVRNPHLLRP